jgi:hypothetical protein
MARRRNPTESHDKDEDAASPDLDLADSEKTRSPLDRFKSLAKRLIKVPRSELDAELKTQRNQRPKRHQT